MTIPTEILSKAREIYEGSWPDPVTAFAEALMEERATVAALLESAKLLVDFAENAPSQDYGEDRVLSWISIVTTNAKAAIAKAERNTA
ncbi:hypothetical protein [Rhizobium leguminosarum]